MTKQETIYKPMLYNFCSDLKKYKNKIDIPGLFLPNVMAEYEKFENKKIFYIGRDIRYSSIRFKKMIRQCTSGKVKDYIVNNNKWLTPANIIKNSYNKPGAFWTMVIRLHIYLHTQKLVNVNQLDSEQNKLLNSIGWGNINSIVPKETLKSDGYWNGIDQDIYSEIKDKSAIFDKLKLILKVYDPDVIFIFNWCDENKIEQVLEGIEVKFNKKSYVNGIIKSYRIKHSKKKIIWSSHPNRLRSLGTNINKVIKILYKEYSSI